MRPPLRPAGAETAEQPHIDAALLQKQERSPDLQRAMVSGMRSAPYDPSYPTCQATYASLCLYSSDEDPEFLDSLLGATGTTRVRTGERRHPRAVPSRFNQWTLSSESAVESKDLRHHIDWVLGSVDPEGLQQATRGSWEATLTCFWLSAQGHGGPQVNADQCARLGGLGVPLILDVHLGDDDSD